MRISFLLATLLAALLCAGTAERAHAGVFVSVTVAPPALPVYEQPPLPGPNYIWTPGYWAWDEAAADYYWVPGTWTLAPEPSLVWTPGYWGWSNGVYVWNEGYWGPTVGFYGGVNYGFGYGGVGCDCGYWTGGVYYYNRAVVNVGVVGVTAVYTKTVVVRSERTSFNGGDHGVKAEPTERERRAASEHHRSASAEQNRHREMAGKNSDLRYSKNQGKPSIAATHKAGDYSKGNTYAARSSGGAGGHNNSGGQGHSATGGTGGSRGHSATGGTGGNRGHSATGGTGGSHTTTAHRSGGTGGHSTGNSSSAAHAGSVRDRYHGNAGAGRAAGARGGAGNRAATARRPAAGPRMAPRAAGRPAASHGKK